MKMNMKSFIVGIIASLSVFVSTSSSIEAFSIESHPKDFKAGWNLVTSDYFDPLFGTGSLKYVYIFDPLLQRYEGGDISNNFDKIANKNFVDATIHISGKNESVNGRTYLGFSMFVFLDDDVSNIVGRKLPGGLETPATSLYLYKGWNFIANLNEFKGKSFNDFKGTCVVSKAYAFDNAKGNWVNIDFLISQDDFDGGDNEIGMGIIVKVTDNCTFDFRTKASVPPVPAIPN